ncbi:MAG: response regulator [Chloroflexi bacterium]|nr:response regulator [Chloroflexota bacterium]
MDSGLSHSVGAAYLRLNLEELRLQTLRLTQYSVLAAILLVMAYLVMVDNRGWLVGVLVVAELAATAWASERLLRLNTRVSAAVLLIGLGLTLGSTAHLVSLAVVAPWFALLVVLAGPLVAPSFSFLAAGLSTALIVGLTIGAERSLGDDQVTSAMLLVWAAAVVAFLLSQPLHTALEWAWSSYAESLRKTEELQDRQGELNRALKTLRDTYYQLETANRELERARRAADEAHELKAQFAANISHELRTPLNLIIGLSELMVAAPQAYEADPLPPAYRGDVAMIYRNARHLSSLIDDVLDLSQIEAGRMGLRKEYAAVSEIVAEAVGAVTPLFERKRLALTSEVRPDLPNLLVDRARIRQILINLLSNAARFTDQGRVTVTARGQGNDVVVAVADTGPGIAPEDIPKVFEEFRQLDGSTRRRRDGSGLGLAISKKFAELHGGTMWAESTPGEGSTFSFSLPLCTNVVSSPLRAQWDTWVRLPAGQQIEGRTVLVVDDDPSTARVFERYLDSYHVLLVAEVEAARKLAAKATMDAIILVSGPGLDQDQRAWSQLRQLEKVPRGVPLVVCSLPGYHDRAQRLHVADYLVKPIARQSLLATIARLGRKVRTILIADDDPEMVSLLVRMLRSSSRRYRVLAAYNGVEALAMVRERRPDLVLLDLLMPDVDGYSVVTQMRADESLRDVPVIVITARDDEAEVVSAGMLSFTREGGLSIGELMRCLRSSLAALALPAGSDQEPSAAPAG